MTTYRKKPVEIQAFQLPFVGDQPTEFLEWAEEVGFENFTSEEGESINIETLEGTTTARPGDWVIRGVAGEFYPCKPDIFEATTRPYNTP